MPSENRSWRSIISAATWRRPYLVEPTLRPPFVTLLASGGHTAILYAKTESEFEILGSTLDDAAGEAFDKVARVLGLKYPGGPNIERCAKDGTANVPMPKMLKGGGGFDFSYSGLKTAVINYCHTKEQKGEEYSKADVAASFQAAALDVLVEKTIAAAKAKGVTTVTAGGGVAANTYLREHLSAACKANGFSPRAARKALLYGQRGDDRVGRSGAVPPRQLCGIGAERQGVYTAFKVSGYREVIHGRCFVGRAFRHAQTFPVVVADLYHYRAHRA